MSQEVISQRVKFTCQGCEKSEEFELVPQTVEVLEKMSKYFTLSRNVVENGQVYQLKVQACGIACVPAAATKLLVLPSASEPVDDINLADLQATKPSDIN